MKGPIQSRLLLALGGVALAALLAEGLARLHFVLNQTGRLEDLSPGRPPPAPGARVRLGDLLEPAENPRLVYRMRPGLDVEFHGVRVATNSRGWREEEIPAVKPPGTVRILGLGDSVLFGWRVDVGDRYLDRLERRLNEEHPERRWQTIALAAPGWNLVMEVEALERDGLAFEPDVVVLGFVPNDFCLPNFVRTRPSLFGVGSHLLRRLRPAAGDDATLRPRQGLAERTGPDAVAPEHPAHGERHAPFCDERNLDPRYRDLVGLAPFYDALAKLLRLADERGFRLVLFHHFVDFDLAQLSLPDALPVVDASSAWRAWLDEHGESEVRDSALTVGGDDIHPSPLGHRMNAEILYRGLLESDALAH